MNGLDAARALVRAGVPLFIAHPVLGPDGVWTPSGGVGGYRLPRRWQTTAVDPEVVDRWEPGQALCAVTGVVLDVVDVDPRNGGDLTALAGQLPKVYGRARTPSDGVHLFVRSLGVRKTVLAPGIDLQAGDPEGRGRGFVFLAPTVKVSKTTHEVASYAWDEPPVVDGLAADDTGAALRLRLADVAVSPGVDYAGPAYPALDVARASWADRYVAGVVGRWGARLATASGWADGVRDDRGRGWEALSRDFAWTLGRLAVCPWTGLTEEQAEELYELVLPWDMYAEKWDAGLLRRAAEYPVDAPPWDGLGDVAVGADGRDQPALPRHWEDGRVAPWMAHKGLSGLWCWASGMRWLWWDGRRWVGKTEESIREAVRKVVVRSLEVAVREEDKKAIDGLRSLLAVGRIGAVVSLMRGLVEIDAGNLDARPDLLNVGNGVVDLRSGELHPHDPALLLTRITEVDYIPGARSDDWEKCLTALEPEVSDWMQVRWGQAATGWPTSDDVLPVMQGGGENGKTTHFIALQRALGEHMEQVPAKLLMANPSDHPTELMTLRGARVAYIDETPEAATVNVARLKAVLGQERMTARAIRQDNVSWRATHSLFLSTNYVPNISETDHGTWRRLKMVKYEKKYERDERFRDRMSRGLGGSSEAVLAWVVTGARRWYDNGRMMPDPPPKVEQDTMKWRAESDLVLGFLDECVVYEDDVAVPAVDLYDSLNTWLRAKRQKPWSDKTASSRLEGHQGVTERGVYKIRLQSESQKSIIRRPDNAMEAISERPWVWHGIRLQ